MLNIGDVIGNRYQIQDIIGKGGMSIVYLAYDMHLQKQWAIKAYRTDKTEFANAVSISALETEADLMRRLDHPRLPHIIDRVIENNEFYIVMDYIDGVSLEKVIANCGFFAQEQIIEWALQICEVLDYLHSLPQPIIYRDLKPANVMLKSDGSVCLIDLGIAHMQKVDESGKGPIVGTHGYAAPEQFDVQGQTDARTDIYALGMLMYHLSTGNNPAEITYTDNIIRQMQPSFSPELEGIISCCVRQNPNERIQSIKDLSYLLSNVVPYPKKVNKTPFFIYIPIGAVVTAFAVLLGVAIAPKITGETIREIIIQKDFSDKDSSYSEKDDTSGEPEYIWENEENNGGGGGSGYFSSQEGTLSSEDKNPEAPPKETPASSSKVTSGGTNSSGASSNNSSSKNNNSSSSKNNNSSSGKNNNSSNTSSATPSSKPSSTPSETVKPAAPNPAKSTTVNANFGSITVTSDKTNYKVGDTITLTVKITLSEPSATLADMYVLFDKSCLKLSSGTGCTYSTTGSVKITDMNGKTSWTGTYKFAAKSNSSAAKMTISNTTVKMGGSNQKMFSRAELEVAIQ